MRKLIFTILGLMIFFSETAWGSLSLTPFYVLFDANSSKRSDVVRITNIGAKKKTYRIRLINYAQKEDGSYQEITEPFPNNPFAAPYIAFSPHKTTLEPRQSQTIRLQRKAMAAAKDGEYVSHLFVQEVAEPVAPQKSKNKDTISIDIRALHGITIPVMIDKGNLNSSANIAQAKIVKNGTTAIAEVMVKRRGTQSFWGTLVVMDGKEEIGRMNNFKIFISNPQRLIKIPLSKNPTKKVNLILIDARSDATISSQAI